MKEDYSDLLGKEFIYHYKHIFSGGEFSINVFVAAIDYEKGITIKPLDMEELSQKLDEVWRAPKGTARKILTSPTDYMWCLSSKGNYREIPYSEMFKFVIKTLRENTEIGTVILTPKKERDLMPSLGNPAPCPFT